MSGYKEFYRRNLPHWHPQNCIYFVTFRLANTIPNEVIKQLVDERHRERREINIDIDENQRKERLYHLEKKYYEKFDTWLDRCLDESPRWLSLESIAKIVSGEIQRLNGKRYSLVAYCIMPNHVHLLVSTECLDNNPIQYQNETKKSNNLSDVMHELKGRTARYCNQELKHIGSFWHHESYDHVVRDEQECERIIRYILNNPVKVGLVSEWRLWPYSFLSDDYSLE